MGQAPTREVIVVKTKRSVCAKPLDRNAQGGNDAFQIRATEEMDVL